jgi:hypothetical protein
MSFTRSRTQILYRYLPGAIFEHDEYGQCAVVAVRTVAPGRLNEGLLRDAVESILTAWTGFGNDAFPSPRDEWDQYAVGVPDEVQFEPFPVVVQCRGCGRTSTVADLAARRGGPYRCSCGDRYVQLPYVVIHQCGRLESLGLPTCPMHGRAGITFNDTGRFTTATWACRECGGRIVSRMTQYACTCNMGTTQAERNKRYVRTNDTAVCYSHTVSFVNLQKSVIEGLGGDAKAHALLLARAWGLLRESAVTLAASRREARPVVNDEMARLAAELLRENPQSGAARRMAALAAGSAPLPGDEVIARVEALVETPLADTPDRAVLEHVALLDTLDAVWPADAADAARSRGDMAGAQDLEEATQFARETLGIRQICCFTNFPLALAAVGYSRVSNRPGEARIQPFRGGRGDGGRVPIYAVTAQTEAIYVQLDPRRVARWLIANGLAAGRPPNSEAEAWAWCMRSLPALSQVRNLASLPDGTTAAERAVLMLLHSISHLLLSSIDWSGFDPESVGEYLLPGALGTAIYANNYTAFTIGGMVTMLEQRLQGWLRDTYRAAWQCVFNPLCDDEGGADSGCLHRQHNCVAFNALLSRATVKGGPAQDIGLLRTGYWLLGDEVEE